MTLNNSWQQQRQQRQQEVVERQQLVYEAIAATKQARQTQASELRDDLSLFRRILDRDDKDRRLSFQQFQGELQSFRTTLQSETRDFLGTERTQRQANAQEFAQQLDAFVEHLRQQTAEFLLISSVQRSQEAQQLAQDLQDFRSSLQVDVSGLRQELKTSILQLRAETQQLMDSNHQHRMQTNQETRKNLAIFMRDLQGTVQNYLSEMEVLRQCRAEQLRQNLRQDRTERMEDMQETFERLSVFRKELQTFRTNLREKVWGDRPGTVTAVAPVKAAVSSTLPSKPAPKPAVAVKPIAKPIATKPPTATGFSKPAAAATVGAFQRGDTVALLPAATEKSSPQDGMAYEKEVFNYIHKIQGARLTEIESSLGINRFQTVDALRSLIKKGLITQRDRLYLVQEDLTHTRG